MKKVLSLILSVIMVMTLFNAISVNGSFFAAETDTAEVGGKGAERGLCQSAREPDLYPCGGDEYDQSQILSER